MVEVREMEISEKRDHYERHETSLDGLIQHGRRSNSSLLLHKSWEGGALAVVGLDLNHCHILVRFSCDYIDALRSPDGQPALLSRLERLLMKRYQGAEVFAIYDEEAEEDIAFNVYLNVYEYSNPASADILKNDLRTHLPTVIEEALRVDRSAPCKIE
jgi:hypothetical protein